MKRFLDSNGFCHYACLASVFSDSEKKDYSIDDVISHLKVKKSYNLLSHFDGEKNQVSSDKFIVFKKGNLPVGSILANVDPALIGIIIIVIKDSLGRSFDMLKDCYWQNHALRIERYDNTSFAFVMDPNESGILWGSRPKDDFRVDFKTLDLMRLRGEEFIEHYEIYKK